MKFWLILIGLALYVPPAGATFNLPGHVPDRIATPIADKATGFTSSCANRNNACSGVCVGNDAGKTCQPSKDPQTGGCACQ
jgi:hypothetical protein